jgi:aminoglycoside phosphotransferase (APT) family kinase protein
VATRDQIGDLEVFARHLAEFLTALYSIATTDGPPAGAHSFNRGGPVQAWHEQTLSSISEMSGVIDAARVIEVWASAMASV